MKPWPFLAVLIGAAVLGCSGASASLSAIEISTAPGHELGFEPKAPSVDFAASIVLTFRNRSSQAHNLVFVDTIDAATRTIVEPGTSDEIGLVVPGPGSYPFVCTIHEGMHGSLSVDAR